MSRFGRKIARPPRDPVPEVEAELLETIRDGIPCTMDDVAKECSESRLICGVEVACYTVTNWGNRHDNEDRVMTARGCQGDLNYHTIGVLDGHDTADASDAVSQMLPGTLAKHFKAGLPIDEAMKTTMADCEQSLKKSVASAGTCVLSCTVAGRYVWCANLGDCRAGLVMLQVPESASSPTKAETLYWMSRDQKASTPEEMKRIRAAGGRVANGRVEGLEPSRTLGDFDVKMQVPPGVISIDPEVRCFNLGSGALPVQAVMVCATDGVWDVISGQDICNLIHARKELAELQTTMLQGGSGRADTQPLRDLAQDLVQFAVARGSRDDCTAVTAMITVSQRQRE